MANVIKHKRGSGSDPVASDLVVGEVAIRTDVGKLFTKMDNGSVAEIAGGGSDIAINTLSSSSGTGGGSATFNGSAYRFTLSQPPSVSAQQLLVSINGVIQKPVAGTGQPSEGFSVDGTDIILGDAPATGSDFFILTFKSLGVSEPADNSVTSAKIADGAIVNADINASAAIAGTKISPDFGSQAITTTGGLSINGATVFNESGADVDFRIEGNGEPNLFFIDAANQRIGIGTATPSQKFHIKSSAPAILFEDTDANGSATSIIEDNNGFMKLRCDNGNAGTGSGIGFEVDASERMRIHSNGRVSIGTTSADASLHIKSPDGSNSRLTLEQTQDAANYQNGIDFKNDGTQYAGITAGKDSSNNSLGLVFHTGASFTERMRINSSGKVNIGDTQMSSNLLNIEDGTAAAIDIASHGSGGDTAYIGVKKSTGGGLTLGISNRDIIFKTGATYSNGTTFDSGTERMRIDSSGNVGIGTSSAVSNSGYGGITLNGGSGAIFSFKDSDVEKTRLALVANNTFSVQYPPGSSGHFRIDELTADGSGNITGATEHMRITNGTNKEIYFNGNITLPGLGNTTTGMAFETTLGSIFMSRNGAPSLYVNNNGSGNQQLVSLRQNGTEVQNLKTQSMSYSSDEKVKKDIEALPIGLDFINKLVPKQFRYNFSEATDPVSYGLIAQELEASLTSSGVTKDSALLCQYKALKETDNKDTSEYWVDYTKMIPVLIKAVQELTAKVEALEAK